MPPKFNDHRTVYILTPEGNYELSTFALVHVAADDPLAQTRFADEDERVAYVQDKIDRSVVPASDIPAASDIKHTFEPSPRATICRRTGVTCCIRT